MDRLIKIVGLIGIVSLFNLFSCSHQQVEFIGLDGALSRSSESTQEKDDLIGFLYLQPELVDSVVTLYPGLLSKRQREPGYFQIIDSGRVKIDLPKEYSKIEDVITHLEEPLISLLKKNFGITNPQKEMSRRVLIFKNTVYVEFLGEASIHALTFKLEDRNRLSIGVAYIQIA